MNISVGSRVRSFDFEGRALEGERASYVEGVVEGIDEENFECPRYKVRVERRVFGGKEDATVRPEEAYVYPPVNGIPKLFGGVTDGVELIDESGCQKSPEGAS